MVIQWILFIHIRDNTAKLRIFVKKGRRSGFYAPFPSFTITFFPYFAVFFRNNLFTICYGFFFA